MGDVRPTTEMMWWTTLALAALDGGLLWLVGRFVRREVFVRLKWQVAAFAFLTYALLWGAFASVLYWDMVYGRLFPAWSRWLLPGGYGLLYAGLARGFWAASLRLPGSPTVTFCLLGGLVSLPGHAWGIRLGLLKVPYLAEVSAASALALGVAEFVVYWSLIVGLAALAARVGSWERSRALASRRAHAWALLSLVLGLHVADEAVHDFLSIYNPTVVAIRGRVPWLPLPTLGWRQWLFGLAAAVVALLALTPLVRRGHRIMLLLGVVFGLLMTGNALLHLVGSLALSRPLPGVWSAPLLLAASLALLWTLRAEPVAQQRLRSTT